MKTIANLTFAGLIGAASLAILATSASAAIVCNAEGDCWHAHQAYEYRPEFHLSVHPDNWRWREGEHYAWREHEGRGYWHGGEWRAF
jgi:hypothetical protein